MNNNEDMNNSEVNLNNNEVNMNNNEMSNNEVNVNNNENNISTEIGNGTKKTNKVLITFVVILIVALLGVVGIFTYNQLKDQPKNNNQNENTNTGNNENETKNNDACAKVTKGTNGYQYEVSGISKTCNIVKLNDKFTLNYKFDANTDMSYDLYVNDVFVKKDANLNEVTYYYVTDNSLVTEKAATTCGMSDYILFSASGETKTLTMRDGMCPKEDTITKESTIAIENNILSFEATSNCGCGGATDENNNIYNPTWYINNDSKISVLSKSSNSNKTPMTLDQLVEQYGISKDFPLEVKYSYDLKDTTNLVPKTQTLKTLQQLYDEKSANYNFYAQ